MFYYPTVLQRHSGCFSTIWLAATKGIKVTRRELLKVNVGRTCEDIIDYVTVQVLPLHPSLPRPRFSLYLSAQLQYGVVIVYHRQCGFLLEEVQHTIDRLLRSKRHIRIDMAMPDRPSLDVPDSLLLLEEAEGAQDPFFGVMGLDYELPSPYKIAQTWQLTETVTQQHPLVASPRITPDEEGFRSPAEAITLREEQLPAKDPEYEEAELPEATARDIDLLLEQQDLFHDVEEREWRREAEEERAGERDGALISIDQLKETVLGGPERGDSVLLPDEQTGQPVEALLDLVPMDTTPRQDAAPLRLRPPSTRDGSVNVGSSGEDDAPPKRRGRRRQLVFADADAQISHDAMQVQINDPLAETLPSSQVLLKDPRSLAKALPAGLFSAPCCPLLHPDLLSLWKQCAVLTTLPRSGAGLGGEEEEEEEEEGGSSDLNVETERRERGRKRRSSVIGVPRELVESGQAPSEASAASELRLDLSRDDKSLELATPVSRGSAQEEPRLPMEPIVEDMERHERDEETDGRELTKEDLLRLVSLDLQRFGTVDFHTLLPPEADRGTVAHMFFKLLELLSAGELAVRQDRSYGPITILPGPQRD